MATIKPLIDQAWTAVTHATHSSINWVQNNAKNISANVGPTVEKLSKWASEFFRDGVQKLGQWLNAAKGGLVTLKGHIANLPREYKIAGAAGAVGLAAGALITWAANKYMAKPEKQKP